MEPQICRAVAHMRSELNWTSLTLVHPPAAYRAGGPGGRADAAAADRVLPRRRLGGEQGRSPHLPLPERAARPQGTTCPPRQRAHQCRRLPNRQRPLRPGEQAAGGVGQGAGLYLHPANRLWRRLVRPVGAVFCAFLFFFVKQFNFNCIF